MIERQHVWLGPEATTFDELCEACLALARRSTSSRCSSTGRCGARPTSGFTTCRRGHRIVVRRVAR